MCGEWVMPGTRCLADSHNFATVPLRRFLLHTVVTVTVIASSHMIVLAALIAAMPAMLQRIQPEKCNAPHISPRRKNPENPALLVRLVIPEYVFHRPPLTR